MPADRDVFLTGATGLLGRYLLRDLLLSGRHVAVLARDRRQGSAAERVAELVAFWSDNLGRPLPSPVVLAGDLGLPGLGLTLADRQWLGRHTPAVVHAAANLSFRSTNGEPWQTNVDGTAALLELCRGVGASEWQHVSTAFVCGRRTGTIREDDLGCGQDFHNPYEQSKFEAERLLRSARHLRVTVYRPSVIVGDHTTGYTSNYAGFYRFLELAARLAEAQADATAPRRLPLRLPLSGEERWNLVPVDWVARAVVELIGRPRWHGQTFHLVSRAPVGGRLLHAVASEELNLTGVELVGPTGGGPPGRLEQLVIDSLEEYWAYMQGHPEFDARNAAAALSDPPPLLDRAALARLIRFAVADQWGRCHRREAGHSSRCAEYIEKTFPRQATESRLARAARLHLLIALDVRGPDGGQWSCRWTHGELAYVKRGVEPGAAVVYHTDTDTFDAILQGRQAPQQAFFEQRLAITGDLETALKLATLFSQFLRENPYPRSHRTEAMDATRS
jgi:thioester reductase-like protein